jgi:PAS domain S-box-containing protein
MRSIVGYTEVERANDGNVVRATGELVDVTEQKRLERSLRDLQQALEDRVREDTKSLGRTVSELNAVIQEKEATLRRLDESESRFRSLVENMNEVFWINDRTTNKLLYMSPSFERMFGQSVEILRNDVQNFINLVHPDDRESALEAFRQARGRGDEYQDFYRTIRPSGEVRWIHSRGRPFHDDPRLFAGMAEDVTDLKSAQGELESLREAAAVEAQVHQKLLAGLSHEVRNPALALSRILDLISREEDPERRKGLIDCSRFAVEQVVTMSESILQVAKLQEEYPYRRSEVFSLRNMLQRLGAVFAAQATGREITVSVGVSPDIPEYFAGDASALRQILFNLLGNALKFTTRGAVRLKVEEGARVPDDNAWTLRFVVEDTGLGIEAERQQEIFNWMRRGSEAKGPSEDQKISADSTGEADSGVGIGLSVVKSLVELLEGEIQLDSSPGVGSTFAISLPFKSVDHEALEASTTQLGSQEGCALSVLLVEDEDISALAATAALKDAGCEVLRISDGEGLSEELRRRSYDLVILDVNLRGTHATEVLDALGEALPSEEWPPILVVSAHTTDEEERRLKDLGVDGYVDKRYEWSTLSQAIGGAVSHYQRKRPDRPVSR